MNNGLTEPQLEQLVRKLSEEKSAILEFEKELDFYLGMKPSHKDKETYKTDELKNEDNSIKKENYYLKKMMDINNVLEEINQNKYGICIDCGQRIGFDRLNSYPMTRYCITCNISV